MDFTKTPDKFGDLAVYGSDALAIEHFARTNPSLGRKLHPDLPYIAAEVIWAVREEMARTVEDVLARRTRALFLNASAAIAAAPETAALMAGELSTCRNRGKTSQLKAFREPRARLPDHRPRSGSYGLKSVLAPATPERV